MINLVLFYFKLFCKKIDMENQPYNICLVPLPTFFEEPDCVNQPDKWQQRKPDLQTSYYFFSLYYLVRFFSSYM